MANNAELHAAAKAKNDEFYTRYEDIEQEMNAYYEYNPDVFRDKTVLCPCDDPEWSNFTRYFAANFSRFGLRKLICTSYAQSHIMPLTLFEQSSPAYDPDANADHGKLFVLDGDTDGSGMVDPDDIRFTRYLDGDGDFRSPEVTKLRDQADIIVTNPPFSLFRPFLQWILDADKKFIIIGSKNAITYKEVFPLLKNNQIWLGPGFPGGNAYFKISNDAVREFASGVYDSKTGLVKFRNVCWFTNIDHGGRHEPLRLDTMAHNLKFNKRLKNKFEKDYGNDTQYPHYDNYDAIEVPFVECIPSDYQEAMGVPITFLEKWDSSQFEIVGADFDLAHPEPLPDGKTGTGRFYVRERESEALVLACGHSKEEMIRALTVMGVPEEDMRWQSGVMGVPITFLDKYDPEQFSLIKFRKGDDGQDLSVNGKCPYFRVLIQSRKD